MFYVRKLAVQMLPADNDQKCHIFMVWVIMSIYHSIQFDSWRSVLSPAVNFFSFGLVPQNIKPRDTKCVGYTLLVMYEHLFRNTIYNMKCNSWNWWLWWKLQNPSKWKLCWKFKNSFWQKKKWWVIYLTKAHVELAGDSHSGNKGSHIIILC